MNSFRKNLGIKIKHTRERIGLSQEALAKELKISRAAISQIETGDRKISAEELVRFSEIFNVPTDVLLDIRKDIEIFLEAAVEEKFKKQETRISVPQRNLKKFKEILIYILEQVGSKPNVGETVIYKLLYFIDFNFYEKYEDQLIGATYIKNYHGPTPKEFIKIAKEMEGKELVKVKDKYFKYPQTKYLPLRKSDLTLLKAHEKEVIDSVLNKLSDMNASEISEYSHNDAPWQIAQDGEVIDYESVFYRTITLFCGEL